MYINRLLDSSILTVKITLPLYNSENEVTKNL